MRNSTTLLLLAGSLSAVTANAQTSSSATGEDDAALPTITISAPRLTRDLYDTPAAVSVRTREEIQRGEQRVRLDEALAPVPGIFLQNRNNFAQGQRISSRGFGARGTFFASAVCISASTASPIPCRMVRRRSMPWTWTAPSVSR
jgi:iron complex outermembrane receptor protein